MAEINRRQFLRGDFRGQRTPLRPPWSSPEAEFLTRCDRCGACAEACAIIMVRDGGFPEIDFAQGGCSFCGDCVAACRTGAITRASEQTPPWTLRAVIGDGCIARQGVVCRVCAEQCDTRAVTVRLVVGGAALPQFDVAACTGCGDCVAPCPVNAISIRPEGIRT